MINGPHSEKLQQKLNEIQSGQMPESSRKKKKLSRNILLLDIVFIIAILIFYSAIDRDKKYESVSIGSQGIEYILSINSLPKKHTVTVNIVNKKNENTEIAFSNLSVGKITINDKFDREIASFPIADNISSISLAVGETRTYLINVDNSILNEYTKKHNDLIDEPKKKVFSVLNSELKLKVTLSLNSVPQISTSLNYSANVD